MPGPLANNYILLGQQLEAILKRRVPPTALEGNQSALLGIADQTVNFRMFEGRVHHENLVANVAGTTLTTSGSVGIDQTLALNAQMPLADRWLGTEPALQAFKGQVMQVNIAGTLKKPAVDKRSVEQFAAQMVRGAVQNTIQNELSKQLDRLLPPKR
jgi:translocation and assembly module TamB